VQHVVELLCDLTRLELVCALAAPSPAVQHHPAGPVVTDVLAGVTLVGLNRLAFGLVPAMFLAGHVIALYSRPLWAGVFLPTLSLFLLLVLLPIARNAPNRVLAVSLVLFVLFAGLSVGVWAAFRRASQQEPVVGARP
jgi:asparagine N-glycosylation enzyme membrane subunit Stt3